MRPRKMKNGAKRLDNVREYLLDFKEDGTPDIEKSFPGYGEIRVEFGCGKGTFVCESALRNPDISFIAVERVVDVAVLAMEKAKSLSLKNVRFITGNADEVSDYLPEQGVSVLYINFCDPWPKKRNAKRRLTFRAFLEKYKRFLKPDGKICFKTDNIDLFEFSLGEFACASYRVEELTYDLHSSEYAADNIVTEYEKNFSDKGVKINRLVAYKEAK